ncbi:MAG: NAD(P)/FAD-dependent oxidoreductase [Actinomycetota bacterium]|nr:NAD(P)/FAD-dependent oxidoreductase [Actinomycetota bacterium]
MRLPEVDAVVIGAGPNGLVAANHLVDAGWTVLVLEAQPEPGGAVRSGEVTAPGFVSDLFSAFYPLGFASPVIASLKLERYGLRWVNAPLVLAHPTLDGRCAVISRDIAETAASLEQYGAGDGAAWRRLYADWQSLGPHIIQALFTPFPPVRAGLRLAAALRVAGAMRFIRFALLPVRRLADEEFAGVGGGLLIAGNALHTDLAPEAAGSTLYGWLLAMIGQQVGFPVPEGGAGQLTAALVRRLEEGGGRVECDSPVASVVVRAGRAAAVRTADGREIAVRRAVLADVDAPQLYSALVGPEHLPPTLVEDVAKFQWDYSTVKVDWALRGPIPWTAADAARAGTVHLAADMDELSRFATELATDQVPAVPFVLVGQMTTTDPTRSPDGTESAWAYSHVPQRVRGDAGKDAITGSWDERETAAYVGRIEDRVEQFAPGFKDLIVARYVQGPGDLERHDANLHRGALNGGTASLHQQLVFRPTPGLGRAETPVRGLFLASSSAHPGGGVHGGPGANAARAALAERRPGRRVLSAAVAAGGRFVRGD